MNLASHAGLIMLAVKNLVKDQQPSGLSEKECEVRENYLSGTGDPFRGASIVYQGEQYSEGTVGTADIGYIVGIVFAKKRVGDAPLADDKIMEWYEKVRRRLMDQRSLAVMADSTSPREHVCIVMPGRSLTKWPDWIVRMLVVAVWIREVPTSF